MNKQKKTKLLILSLIASALTQSCIPLVVQASNTDKDESLVYTSDKDESLVYTSDKDESLVYTSDEDESLVYTSDEDESLVGTSESEDFPDYEDFPDGEGKSDPKHDEDEPLPSLWSAVIENDLDKFKNILSSYEIPIDELNRQDENGNTVLNLAINRQNFPLVQFILANYDVDLNLKNATGQTPIDIVRKIRDDELVNALAKSIDTFQDWCKSGCELPEPECAAPYVNAMHMEEMIFNFSEIRNLIRQYCDEFTGPLKEVHQYHYGYIDVSESALKAILPFITPDTANIIIGGKSLADHLLNASLLSTPQKKLMISFLDRGVKNFDETHRHYSDLIYALMNQNRPDLFQQIVPLPQRYNSFCRCIRDGWDVSWFVEQAELDPNMLYNGVPMLVHAIKSNQPHIALYLIERGADVNVNAAEDSLRDIFDKDGMRTTLLHLAIAAYGNAISIYRRDRSTPDHHLELIKLLISKIDKKYMNTEDPFDPSHNTPLAVAFEQYALTNADRDPRKEKQFFEIVELLLKNGAKVSPRNSMYGSILASAERCGKTEFARFLRKHGAIEGCY